LNIILSPKLKLIHPLVHSEGLHKTLKECMLEKNLNHRIIGWKRRLRSSSPTICPTPSCLL